MKVLITCPPMLKAKEEYLDVFTKNNIEVFTPNVVQALSENELISLVPQFDGWIIGDDPATRKVFIAGKKGKLKAAVKWGIGVDNVDLLACSDLHIPFTNTPNMFGPEVADIALCYLIGLARDVFLVDRLVRKGEWPKNRGISLNGKTIGIVGYGDIGKNVLKRILAIGSIPIIYDPFISENKYDVRKWPNSIENCDFIIFTCALSKDNYHMFDQSIIDQCKLGVRIINVARGSLIDEKALFNGLKSKKIHSVALDVFEEEPLPKNSRLRTFPQCVFGSHNSSNTRDAVKRTNELAIKKLFEYLGV